MPEDSEVVRVIQDFCGSAIFDRKTEGRTVWDVYKPSWLEHGKKISGRDVKEETLSRFTTLQIQQKVQESFGTREIEVEKKVGGASKLSFDLWNKSEGTAIEICLGAIKNEFEKDVLKGVLDRDTTKLIIFYREYKFGTQGTIFGKKWFDHPAQQEIIERAGIFKLKVEPMPLVV